VTGSLSPQSWHGSWYRNGHERHGRTKSPGRRTGDVVIAIGCFVLSVCLSRQSMPRSCSWCKRQALRRRLELSPRRLAALATGRCVLNRLIRPNWRSRGRFAVPSQAQLRSSSASVGGSRIDVPQGLLAFTNETDVATFAAPGAAPSPAAGPWRSAPVGRHRGRNGNDRIASANASRLRRRFRRLMPIDLCTPHVWPHG